MGSSLNMLGKIVSLSLVALAAGQASVPLTPGNIPGLVPGSPAAAAWWTAQIAHAGQLAHHVGKRQAAIPLTPGNIPGLVPGSEAARQWWTNQLLWAEQQAHHWARGKLLSGQLVCLLPSALTIPSVPSPLLGT